MSDDAAVTNAMRIADHEILREIGRGGMGVVYLARQRMLDRLEVLKVMSESLVRDPAAAERFLREIRAAARLHHPNIVTAYSASMVDRTLAFAMEYVEGVDLAKLVAARGPLPVGEACWYARDAAIGLQHAYEQGMVHRDIKPSNLMVAKSGVRPTVKILDFGLAKATREVVQGASLTFAGQFLGTIEYMSPEQARDAATADIRSDIYSLGCTLFYLLTGSPPFQGGLLEVLRSHEHTEPENLQFVRGDVPHEVAAVIQKMLHKHPEERFAAPGEVAEALAAFAAAPEATALADFSAPATHALGTALDTKSLAQEMTVALAAAPSRLGLMEPAAPWVVRWFPAYCLLGMGTALSAFAMIVLAVVVYLSDKMYADPPMPWSDVHNTLTGGAIIGIPLLVGAAVFLSGLFVKRRPVTWAFGFALLLAGVCFAVPCPLSLVMIYYWMQEDARRYFFEESAKTSRQY